MSKVYGYEGRCPQSGILLRLPRTPWVEAIARRLMQSFSNDASLAREGKMYGILLVETPDRKKQVLKAFSGLLNGKSEVAGWVPPIGGRDRLILAENRTLALLSTIKQELLAQQYLPERQQHQALSKNFTARLQALTLTQQQRKQERQYQRQQLLATLTESDLIVALEQLDEESRQAGIAQRRLKRQRNEALQPLKQQIDRSDARIRHLKQQRKALSQQLQKQMEAAYYLTNFAGESLSVQSLMQNNSLPSGTGDCCAPKLLHYAATHGLKPLAMAEFWWGQPSGNKVSGEFYEACAERCQPLMGFLLSGLSGVVENAFLERDLSLPILYEDAWLIAVNKPSGLLSVPGRTSDRADSVLTRLRYQLPDSMTLKAVHRLDLATSGILLLAKEQDTYRQLSQQFQQRQVNKIYEAILAGSVIGDRGTIELPLWGDPSDRPYQKVDWQQGKPSITHFQAIARQGKYTRVQFQPITGRTHQLRVHAAKGLGVAILGDLLYGCTEEGISRLHLHARELHFEHPQLGKGIDLKEETPF